MSFPMRCIAVVFIFALIPWIITEQTRIYYFVRRVFLSESNPTLVAQNFTTRYTHSFDQSCPLQLPTLFTLFNLSVTNSNNQIVPQEKNCNTVPLSIFAQAVGIQDSNSTAISSCGEDKKNQNCTVLQQNEIGGFWSNEATKIVGVITNEIAPLESSSSKYVSITTYSTTASMSAEDAKNQFIGQTSSNSIKELNYCPGTSSITSSFIFHSDACITSPLLKNTNQMNEEVKEASSISLLPIEYSWKILTNFKAFYAICKPENGIVIQGCEDVDCRKCRVLTDSFGCFQDMNSNRVVLKTDNQLVGSEKFFVNFQGCGVGRANSKTN